MTLVTVTSISSFAEGSHHLWSGGVRPLLPLATRPGKASQPGGPASWEFECDMGLSSGSLLLSLSHLAAIFFRVH